jgi:hypothetical protein
MTYIHLVSSVVAILCTLIGFYEGLWRENYDKGSFYLMVSTINLLLVMH